MRRIQQQHPLAKLLLLGALALNVCTGCNVFRGEGGDLTLRSETGQSVDLGGAFDRGMYSYNGQDTLTIVLVQGTFEQPTRAVTARLFWRPKAGHTPIDRTATNTTVRYVEFDRSGDRPRVTVYSGAGFMYLRSKPGEQVLSAELWDAALRLTDASFPPGAIADAETLGEASLAGRFRAPRDDAGVLQALRRLNHQVSRALEYPRMVRAGGPGRSQR